jgi:hypothetical protein
MVAGEKAVVEFIFSFFTFSFLAISGTGAG